jgi:hypothetical protein
MKKSSSLIPLILSFLSFFLIGIGAASIFLFQSPLQSSKFDTRDAASVDTGLVLLSTSPATAASFVSNQPATIYLQVNTQGTQVDGVQLTFKITTTAGELVVNPVVNSGIQVTNVEVEKVSDGFLVSFAALPLGNNTSFSSTTATNVVQLVLSKLTAGTTQITFDNTNSKSIVHDSDPAQDELKTMPIFNYTIVDSATPSPSPSTQQCNTSCSSNSQCPSNFFCYQNQCRLATNPTSTTCISPPDKGLQRTCNQYCADTKECQSGYTCFNNRCRKPENPDSATCGQVSVTTTQAMNKSCNLSCASNKECAVNLRCYNGSCRLATNPSSTSCAASTQSTVSTYYGKGQKGSSDGSDSLTSTLSAKPTASVQPGTGAYTPPVSATSNSTSPFDFLKNLMQNIEARGISFPAIAVAIGVLLLVLAIIATLLGRRRNSSSEKMPPIRVVSQPEKPVQPMSAHQPESYESGLRSKIAELKTEPTRMPDTEKPPMTPPIQTAPVAAPLVSAPAGQVATPEQTSASGSSMMERLKQKQILDKMPNPTTPSNSK